MGYQPTEADMAFQQYAGDDPFEEAHLMQSISDEYLSVLACDNSGERSAGFRAMIEVEIARRGTLEAKHANRLAKRSFALAAAALFVAVVSIFV